MGGLGQSGMRAQATGQDASWNGDQVLGVWTGMSKQECIIEWLSQEKKRNFLKCVREYDRYRVV